MSLIKFSLFECQHAKPRIIMQYEIGIYLEFTPEKYKYQICNTHSVFA